jgi:ABC-type amino acid transport substrate-binding protein
MNRTKIYALLFLACLIPLFSSAQVAAQTDNSLSKVQSAGKIVIGTNAEYAPFESRDPVTNDIIGFDVDIANYIAQKLGVEIQWVDVAFDVLITQLAANNFDCVIAAMSVTEERKQSVSFTRWYYKSEQAVLVRIGNMDIKSVDDINKSSIKAGAQDGTVSAGYIADETVAQLISYSTITLAVAALEQNTIDAVLGDYAVLASILKSQPNKFKIVDTFSPEDFAIAVPKASNALLAKLNEIINELLGTDLENPQPSEKYNEIYKKWFDVDAAFPGQGNQINGFPIIGLAFAVTIGVLYTLRKMRKA